MPVWKAALHQIIHPSEQQCIAAPSPFPNVRTPRRAAPFAQTLSTSSPPLVSPRPLTVGTRRLAPCPLLAPCPQRRAPPRSSPLMKHKSAPQCLFPFCHRGSPGPYFNTCQHVVYRISGRTESLLLRKETEPQSGLMIETWNKTGAHARPGLASRAQPCAHYTQGSPWSVARAASVKRVSTMRQKKPT